MPLSFLIKSKMTADALTPIAADARRKSDAGYASERMGNAEVLLSDPRACVIRGVTKNAGRVLRTGCIDA